MNVTDLMAELAKMPPHLPVRVVTSEAYYADESGESQITLCDDDATEAESVHFEGTHVLVRGK